MKIFLAFTFFLISALLIGAAFAYPIHLATDIPVEKLVTKVGKLIATLSLIYFLRIFHLNNKNDAGYTLNLNHFSQQFISGLGIGIVTLCILSAMILLLDIRILDPDFNFSFTHIIKTLFISLCIGTLVALIEETFFRGVMFAGIQRSTSLLAAIVLTAVLYSGVHFIKSKGVEVDSASPWSGFDVLSQIAGNIFQLSNLDSFLALLTVGLFLSLVRANKGNIAQCIGIHAGWVMVIKTTKDVTDSNKLGEYAYLVGSYDGIVGWLCFGYLCLLCSLYYFFIFKNKEAP